jgi:hypothetical protein
MGGQLYVIGELKGEITLFVLDAANGKLDWSQPLATVETPVALDSFRRLHGSSPSFADGVMVCPTTAGAVVAVDVANRSLLWGYQYPRNQAMNLNLARRTGEVSDPFGTNRWRDGSVIVASGRVVVTPADSDQLHCINLLDGKEAWKPVARGDNLFVGGVQGGTILVVGRRQVQGLELIDGQPSWPAQPLGEEGTGVPSGRGFQSGGHYYLPLSSAEVIKIDLADGTIKSRAKSRKGYVLGNLVCNQGSVLSLTRIRWTAFSSSTSASSGRPRRCAFVPTIRMHWRCLARFWWIRASSPKGWRNSNNPLPCRGPTGCASC